MKSLEANLKTATELAGIQRIRTSTADLEADQNMKLVNSSTLTRSIA